MGEIGVEEEEEEGNRVTNAHITLVRSEGNETAFLLFPSKKECQVSRPNERKQPVRNIAG